MVAVDASQVGLIFDQILMVFADHVEVEAASDQNVNFSVFPYQKEVPCLNHNLEEVYSYVEVKPFSSHLKVVV